MNKGSPLDLAAAFVYSGILAFAYPYGLQAVGFGLTGIEPAVVPLIDTALIASAFFSTLSLLNTVGEPLPKEERYKISPKKVALGIGGIAVGATPAFLIKGVMDAFWAPTWQISRTCRCGGGVECRWHCKTRSSEIPQGFCTEIRKKSNISSIFDCPRMTV